MARSKLTKLVELISELVAEHDPYATKKRAVLDACADDDEIAVREFAAWFYD